MREREGERGVWARWRSSGRAARPSAGGGREPTQPGLDGGHAERRPRAGEVRVGRSLLSRADRGWRARRWSVGGRSALSACARRVLTSWGRLAASSESASAATTRSRSARARRCSESRVGAATSGVRVRQPHSISLAPGRTIALTADAPAPRRRSLATEQPHGQRDRSPQPSRPPPPPTRWRLSAMSAPSTQPRSLACRTHRDCAAARARTHAHTRSVSDVARPTLAHTHTHTHSIDRSQIGRRTPTAIAGKSAPPSRLAAPPCRCRRRAARTHSLTHRLSSADGDADSPRAEALSRRRQSRWRVRRALCGASVIRELVLLDSKRPASATHTQQHFVDVAPPSHCPRRHDDGHPSERQTHRGYGGQPGRRIAA